MNILDQTLQEALARNEHEIRLCTEYKNDLVQATKNLTNFQSRLQVDVMVPIGNKALVPGFIYHTNEALISHSNGTFIETSSHKALEVVQRRLKIANQRLKELQDEGSLFRNKLELPQDKHAFSANDQEEIIEEYNEESEVKWREEHKRRVKEEKEKERELRLSGKDQEEIDLFNKLDELELLEELEDEFSEILDVENEIPSIDGEVYFKEKPRSSHFTEEFSTKVEDQPEVSYEEPPVANKRKSLQFSDVEKVQLIHKNERPNSLRPVYDPELTLNIKFNHSPTEHHPSMMPSEVIQSPSDIYKKFANCMKYSTTGTPDEVPKSILKKTTGTILVDKKAKLVSHEDVSEIVPEEHDFIRNNIFNTIVGDIVERNPNDEQSVSEERPKPRRVSRFKASRGM